MAEQVEVDNRTTENVHDEACFAPFEHHRAPSVDEFLPGYRCQCKEPGDEGNQQAAHGLKFGASQSAIDHSAPTTQ